MQLNADSGKSWLSALSTQSKARTALGPGKALSHSTRSTVSRLSADQLSSRNKVASVGGSAARIAAHAAMMSSPPNVSVPSRPTAVMPHRAVGMQINALPRRPVGAPPSMSTMQTVTQHSFARVGAATGAPAPTIGINRLAPQTRRDDDAMWPAFRGTRLRANREGSNNSTFDGAWDDATSALIQSVVSVANIRAKPFVVAALLLPEQMPSFNLRTSSLLTGPSTSALMAADFRKMLLRFASIQYPANLQAA